MAGQYEIIGLRRLTSTMRKAGADMTEMKAASARAGGIIAAAASARSPRVTGRLAGSIRTAKQVNRVQIMAGGAAFVPGVGTMASLATGAAEAVAALDASVLYTLAVAEVHGLPLDDVERRRALVLGVVLGEGGTKLMQRATGKSRWARELAEELSARGHEVMLADAVDPVMGTAQTIQVDHERGYATAVTDPRGDGVALAL